MLIGDLFEKDVTRAIPPVVYFHEQTPAELEREVGEYIITGGYPKEDSRYVADGIHEQFVRLLTALRTALSPGGSTKDPACWISGFYGSGKSSFAKLLGLALDGRTLPSGKALSQALLEQDHSHDAEKFALAWVTLLDGLRPMAVVFDVGSRARDDEHVHTVVVREVQRRLGYCTVSNLVAEYELKLELEKLDGAFRDKVKEVHGKPWTELSQHQLAEDYFSAALHALQPDLYPEKLSWVESRSGSRFDGKRSADEAVTAIRDMMNERAKGCTLFLVVDEVSQYVHDDDDRMLALQSFVSSLGATLKGKAWLLATGQQKLEEAAGQASAIVKLKDRFPPALRVHLGVTNIRDVVHKRLLRKAKMVESDLKALFEQHRSELALYAYRGDEITNTDFVEVYPMLPGQVQLLLDITTGLRSRSRRTQGDSHAIRGLLQLLGDLFREKELARFEVGRLLTLDLIFDVLHSALDGDVQMTLARAFDLAKREDDALMTRVVKTVAMLELAQDTLKKVSAELVARCLYETLGQGNYLPEVQRALDALAGESLIAYSEQSGYKIESSAGQEWQKERDGYVPGPELQSKAIQEALSTVLKDAPGPTLGKAELPWLAFFSDSYGSRDARLRDERKNTIVCVDFQFLKGDGNEAWLALSETGVHRERILWVAGDLDGPRDAARRVLRSARMVEDRGRNATSMTDERQRLLRDESIRLKSAQRELIESVREAFIKGQLYFRGRSASPRDLGHSFEAALTAYGNRAAAELYPHPVTDAISDKDILYLIENADLAAPPAIFGPDHLGVLSLDAGRYEATCSGRVPSDVLAYIQGNAGVTGSTLLAHFGAPPHGVSPDALRASVVGLLRAGKVRIDLSGGGELIRVRDEGARELLKDSVFRKASLFVNTEQVDPRVLVKVCQFFKDALGVEVNRSEDAIADAALEAFKGVRERLTDVEERFRNLPRGVAYPDALTKLAKALEDCRRSRNTKPVLSAVTRQLPALRDGVQLLRRMETDLTEASCARLVEAQTVLNYRAPSLVALGASAEELGATDALKQHLASERPWEDATELGQRIEVVKRGFRERRKRFLSAHATSLEDLSEQLKRREGIEKLDPDQRHRVLRHVQDAASAGGAEDDVAPALETLESFLSERRRAAEQKALVELDALLEEVGAGATVEIRLELSGREIRSQAELERLLEALRKRVLEELARNHRVRLK
jgi:hypothetical protein